MTHFSERIPIVKQRMAVLPKYLTDIHKWNTGKDDDVALVELLEYL
jgi:hypothetical protein